MSYEMLLSFSALFDQRVIERTVNDGVKNTLSKSQNITYALCSSTPAAYQSMEQAGQELLTKNM